MGATTLTSRGPAGRAFTVVELLVVVGIILLVLAIAVPAFSSMLYSSQRSLAVNGLRGAVTTARDIALRADRGGDGAVVFLFDAGGQLRIVPAVQVGTLTENATGQLDELGNIERDVFVPSPIADTVTLPKFWAVSGYAPAGFLVDTNQGGVNLFEWYDGRHTGGDPGVRGAVPAAKFRSYWLFPESGFYDVDEQTPGAGQGAGNISAAGSPTGRQSFMIRFEAGTGIIKAGGRSALFVDPRPSAQRPYSSNPLDAENWKRVDLAESVENWAVRVLRSPDPDGDGRVMDLDSPDGSDQAERSRLLGSSSNDTVLVKSVDRIALYDLRRLASGVGARGLNRDTDSLYQAYASADGIALDMDLFRDLGSGDETLAMQNIGRWIVGDTEPVNGGQVGDGQVNSDPDDGPVDEPEARVFVVQPYSGELREVES